MVQCSNSRLDTFFAALSDPTRRSILERFGRVRSWRQFGRHIQGLGVFGPKELASEVTAEADPSSVDH